MVFLEIPLALSPGASKGAEENTPKQAEQRQNTLGYGNSYLV